MSQSEQYLVRELLLKRQVQYYLNNASEQSSRLKSELTSSKVTLLVDDNSNVTLECLRALLDKDVPIISDVLESTLNWTQFHDHIYTNVIADLRHSTRLYPFQVLNILQVFQLYNIQLLKSDHIYFLTNQYIYESLEQFLLKYTDDINVIELPTLLGSYEEQFESVPTDNKITKVLQYIKSTQCDVVIYCETLHEMDQLYQALHFHSLVSHQQEYEVHLVLPSEPHYAGFLRRLCDIAYPKIKPTSGHKIFLAANSQDLAIELTKCTHTIGLVIHMGYFRDIKQYNQELQVIIYKTVPLSKADLLIRNRVAYFPKVLYMFSQQEFQQLSADQLILIDEFQFNQEALHTRASVLNITLSAITPQDNIAEEFYITQIPYPYHQPMLETEDQTLNHYSHIVATLCTDGELLSNGNLDPKRNPLKSFGVNQSRETIIRCNHYWSKMGDCTSWVQMINKFVVLLEEIIQCLSEQLEDDDTSTDLFRLQNELIKWCRTQNVNMPKLVIILAYNEYILEVLKKQYSEFSVLSRLQDMKPLNLNRTVSLKKQSSMPEHSEDIQIYLLRQFYKGICVFSGHKQAGYHNFVLNKTLRLSHCNLMSLIGDFPLTCIVLAFKQNQSDQLEIKYSNKVEDIIIPTVAPKAFVQKYRLQFIQKQSLHLHELTFKNIGQVMFNELWKNQQGPKVSQECMIEPNLEMNLITVLYDPNLAKPDIITTEINEQITKLNNQFQNQVKEIAYENDTKFIMQAGAVMKDWIDTSAYRTFFIEGLPLDIIPEELQDLLGDILITDVRLHKVGEFINARITLDDHNDIEWCLENVKEYKNNKLKVYNQHDQYDYVEQQLKFKECYKVEVNWNININRGTALIQYTPKIQKQVEQQIKEQVEVIQEQVLQVEQVEQVIEQVQQVIDQVEQVVEQIQQQQIEVKQDQQTIIPEPLMIDGQQVQIEYLPNNTIQLSNLMPHTYVEDIQSALKDHIDITHIEMEYKFRYENKSDILEQINRVFETLHGKYTIESISKVMSQRNLVLLIPLLADIDEFLKFHNSIKSIMGQQVKLRVQSAYYHDYEGPIEMKQVFQDIFDEKKQLGSYSLNTDLDTQRMQVRVKTNTKEDHQKLNGELELAFVGRKVEHADDLSCLFSQQGVKQLKQWEQQLSIIIKQDYLSNVVYAHCSDEKFQQLIKLIEDLFKSSCKCTIQIPKSAARSIMGDDSNGIMAIKKNFELLNVKYNNIAQELHLYGKQSNIDLACQAVQEIVLQQSEKPIAAVTCNYCFDQMKNGYMLQGCGHKFCLQCIMFSVQNCLGDMSALPIRCPQCNCSLQLADLYILLDEVNWQKLIKLSINKYIQDNLTELNFCLTPNCPVIYYNKIPRYTCKLCKNNYCNTCRALYHYGQTCREFKAGGDESINIYMKKYDIRRCPNCKFGIQRIDGCYRVTCSACQHSICWKNNKEGKPCMAIYKTASECYSHLTKEHGGYW